MAHTPAKLAVRTAIVPRTGTANLAVHMKLKESKKGRGVDNSGKQPSPWGSAPYPAPRPSGRAYSALEGPLSINKELREGLLHHF